MRSASVLCVIFFMCTFFWGGNSMFPGNAEPQLGTAEPINTQASNTAVPIWGSAFPGNNQVEQRRYLTF